jgi:hypothetical protein
LGNTLLRIAFGKMVGSLQTMDKGKLDLVKECRILGCPTWRQGISNLFKIVNEKKTKKHSFNNLVKYFSGARLRRCLISLKTVEILRAKFHEIQKTNNSHDVTMTSNTYRFCFL